LNVHWFADLADARSMIEEWGRLGNRTPSEFAAAFNIQAGLQRLGS
jgi:transposase InsO family protein